MERITACRLCGSGKIEEFLDLGNQPFANSLLPSAQSLDPFYPLSLSFCFDCSLVQLNHTANPGELFSQYVWVTGTSNGAREYAQVFADRVLNVYPIKKKEYILEAASNDGTFLKAFSERGVSVLGVDPARNIVAMANEAGVPTECHFFAEKVAKDIVSSKGEAAIAIARNVVPHVANLHDFISGMAAVLKKDGMMVLELHHADTILKELHYDSIYHEHLCFFSFKAAEKLLARHRFGIFHVDPSPISGGSMVLYASRNGINPDASVELLKKKEKISGVNTWEEWQNFARRTFLHRDELLRILGEKTIGWGASARSSTLLNFCRIGTDRVSSIIDNNPMKQGLFTPGTHIPIESAQRGMAEKPETVFVLAWNFLREIGSELYHQHDFRGEIIAPFPGNPVRKKIEEIL